MNEIESLQIAIASVMGIVPTNSQCEKILQNLNLVRDKKFDVTIAQLKGKTNGHSQNC